MFSPSITMGPHIHTPEFLQTVGPTITSQRPGNLKHQPSQQYSRRKYAVPQWTWYTIHPQSSWNFRWKIPFLHDIWWPLVGFDFLPPKRPWSTGHPLRRSIELSPTDREKNILGKGHRTGSWRLVKVKVILIWNLTGMFAWTVTLQTPKIQRTPYYACLISATVHLNFGECGVKKQHSIQYCECPDRSCFVWSNKANVVYQVLLLVGQHIIAAEKTLQKHCKGTSAIHMLCSCQHHNKDVHNCSYIVHPKSKSAF